MEEQEEEERQRQQRQQEEGGEKKGGKRIKPRGLLTPSRSNEGEALVRPCVGFLLY